MSRVVCKRDLDLVDESRCGTVKPPLDSKIVGVGASDKPGQISIWFDAPDHEQMPEPRFFMVRDTDEPVVHHEDPTYAEEPPTYPKLLTHVGMVRDGQSERHVFEVTMHPMATFANPAEA